MNQDVKMSRQQASVVDTMTLRMKSQWKENSTPLSHQNTFETFKFDRSNITIVLVSQQNNHSDNI